MAWRCLVDPNQISSGRNCLHLVFSLFINWFNPRGNKILGKQESLGCLNLPPELHNKVEFTLLYAIIPGPNAPDIITISNTLKPLVDEFLVLSKGLNVNTYKYPHGQKMVAQLLPLVGYLVTIHKVVGFGSHSESQFCCWCTSELTRLPTLKIRTRRNAVDILQAAQAWKEAKSLGHKK
ncbi:hypothetical protein O181_012940 [Austropuccinia psidii MF-1]|uniref:Uncharacterized protein n=1 Tax=Austropuccinia psidii MF-1 TaxID=1389203 RepID=A0A9Q3BY24_9BASI|nr:hypothetical protein [Austropuccinia psidii MF-1]